MDSDGIPGITCIKIIGLFFFFQRRSLTLRKKGGKWSVYGNVNDSDKRVEDRFRFPLLSSIADYISALHETPFTQKMREEKLKSVKKIDVRDV